MNDPHQTTERFDRVPAWVDLNSPDRENVLASIKLACPTALGEAISRTDQPVPADVATVILESWPGRKGLVRLAVTKSVLSDGLLSTLLVSGDSDHLRTLLQRSDLTVEILHQIAQWASMQPGVSRFELATIAMEHPACDAGLVAWAWQSLGSHRHVVFNARSIPPAMQDAVLRDGTAHEKLKLLTHPSTSDDARRTAAESLLAEQTFEYLAAAINSGALAKDRLAELVMSSDVRVAMVASDRIAEVASRLRLRDYARAHAGVSRGPVNAILADHIRRGLPLGWFVAGCFLLRPLWAKHSSVIAKELRWIADQPRGANLRDLAGCETDQLQAFTTMLTQIPEAPRRRLVMASLKSEQITTGLVRDFAGLAGKEPFGENMRQIRWKQVRDLLDLYVDLRAMIDLANVPNFYISPHRHPFWAWLRELDRRAVAGAYVLLVPRSAHRIRRWAIELRNCLSTYQYAEKFKSGQVVVIGVMRGRRVVYAVEASPTGKILQIAGVRNCKPPNDVREAVINAVNEARARAGLNAPQAPGPPPDVGLEIV